MYTMKLVLYCQIYDEASSTTTTTTTTTQKKCLNWNYCDLVMVIGRMNLFISRLTKQALPIVFNIECGVVNPFLGPVT